MYRRLGRVSAVVGVTTATLAIFQASELRKRYIGQKKLVAPEGPNNGLFRCVDTFKKLNRDVVVETALDMVHELKATIETKTDHLPTSLVENLVKLSKGLAEKVLTSRKCRKVQLIVLGDSLVCGIGCDEGREMSESKIVSSSSSSSPSSSSSSSSQSLSLSGAVLPQIVAKVLSVAMHADVEWSSVGIVGGTVADIRGKLLPEMKKKLDAAGAGVRDQDTEVLVVVICGLNDFKQLMEKFPHGPGPTVFKEELGKLVKDIKDMGKELCVDLKLFLPSIPVVVGRGDPTCHIMIRPLDNFVEYVAYIWDQQKKAIAIDDRSEFITYIGNPTPDKHYATPGRGNFSSDGIHPSQQGYRWWGYHIAECILASNLDDFLFRVLPVGGEEARGVAAAVA